MAAAIPFALAGLGAFSAYSRGQEEAQAAKQQEAIARRNQQLQLEQARTARQQAGAEEEATRRAARQQLGRQSAAIGQAGIGYGGTAGLLQEDSAMQAELDALNVRYGGELQAQGLLNSAAMSGAEAKIYSNNAKQAKRSALIGAGTSLLGAFSGGMFGGGTGLNMQGRTSSLLSNPAYVRNM